MQNKIVLELDIPLEISKGPVETLRLTFNVQIITD